VGILAESTIRYLAGVITGDGAPSPSRKLRDIESFFVALGVPLNLGRSGSRGPLTVEILEALNEANTNEALKRVVQASVDPRHYLPELLDPESDKEIDAAAVLQTLDGCLGYDGYRLVPQHGGYGMVLAQRSVPPSEGLHDGDDDLSDPGITPEPHTVFVVHGRNTNARDAMYEFLGAVGLNALDWEQALNLVPEPNPYVGDVLDAALARAQAIVVLLTPDDDAQLRFEYLEAHDEGRERNLTGQPRPNVLFEAGMAMALMRKRTVLVAFPGFLPFSDIDGRHILRAAETSAFREQMVNRLKRAGCPVDEAAGDWQAAGDFSGGEQPSHAVDRAEPQDAALADQLTDDVARQTIEWVAARDARPAATAAGEAVLKALIGHATEAAKDCHGRPLEKLLLQAAKEGARIPHARHPRFWELGDAFFVWLHHIAAHYSGSGAVGLLPTIHYVRFVQAAFLGSGEIRTHADYGGEWVQSGARLYDETAKDRVQGTKLLDDLVGLGHVRSEGGTVFALTTLADELFKPIT